MKFSKGDIVVINFPYSDLINAKKRPMLVLAERGEDILGCAITSNPASEGVPITGFEEGNLPLQSKIKHWQINTFLKDLVIKKIAKIHKNAHKELLSKINELIKI
ncbi:MAG TPA: type II toxin-antitoxin system PemK/MazF family toxin [Candidatus Nanoarchaeia archaeon]|nr:type II toxin-antitoxin system PemK/MazF family toxin [Candidatus Nanoarchaeia archaeon]